MLDALTITEAEAAGLSELAALDLAMARDFAARAQAAEDPESANDLARSYQRMARSYRQTLALKVRLQADMVRVARDTPAVPREERRIRDRLEAVREAVQRVILAEHEPAEAPESEATEAEAIEALDFGPESEGPCMRLFDLLDERLALLARDNRFGLEPLDDHVAAVCATLGLDPAIARRWRDLPDADAILDEPPDAPAWRGSG